MLDDALDLVGDIYDCAIEPAGWTTVLERIAKATRADCAGIALADLIKREVTATFSWNVRTEHFEGFMRSAPYNPMITSGWFWPIGEPFTAAMYLGEEEYRRSRFYREMGEGMGIDDAIMCNLVKSVSRLRGLSLPRVVSEGPITEEDLAFVRKISPHVRRAITISDLLDARPLDSLAATLDLLTVGVALTDAQGRIAHMNRAAAEMVENRAALRRDGDFLSASNPVAALALREAITSAGLHPKVQLPACGISVPLPTNDRGRDLAAWVLPLDAGMRSELAAPFSARIAVFLRELGDTSVFPGELFVKRYGITPAECRVLMMLVQGVSLGEAADCLGISMPTAKTHIARLFAKTETRNQSDLMRLAVSALAPARAMP